MRHVTTLLALLACAACGSGSDPTIHAGDDLTGDWFGCVDDDCREHTPRGIRFESDGGVKLIGVSKSGGHCDTGEPIFEKAHWEWLGDHVLVTDVIGIGDDDLDFAGDRVQVPFHPDEPGFIFAYK